jgi:diguanylate cyclase (GGDEF)-like protein
MILVDDPARKQSRLPENELCYIAAFGPASAQITGKRASASSGVIGETYVLGKSAVRKADPKERIVLDRINFPHPVNTLVSVPLKVESAVIGVLLLYNKKEPVGFTLRDLKLAEIFAGYIATSLQNAIDARKSQELSKRDDLTGLANDRFFHRQLEADVKAAEEGRRPLCLLFLDLDNFKSINDQHGHLVGSQTLKEIGFILREAVGERKSTLARYGGDEYVIILPGSDLEEALEVAEAVRRLVEAKLFMIDRGEQDGSFINFKGILTCSIGVASLQDHVPAGGSPKEQKNHLIRLADQAMYRAKEQGKNRAVVARTV